MTYDAFEKAQELHNKLHMVHEMQNIICNSTLSADTDYHKPHNDHVINDDMILCYMHKATNNSSYAPDVKLESDIIRSDGGRLPAGNLHMGGNFIFGKDVPLDLVEALERTLSDYESKVRKEFEELTSDYKEPVTD